MKTLLCKLGIHRPLIKNEYLFTDKVSGRFVFNTNCPCGREYMTDGGKWFGFKVLNWKEKTIDVGKRFSKELNSHNVEHFCYTYLFDLLYTKRTITFDLKNVKRMAPSFVSEIIKFFEKTMSREFFKERIKFINISPVKQAIIDVELEGENYV